MEDTKTPHPVDTAVGRRVRAARIESGLSQGALADKLGVSFQQVQKYENGANRISASRMVEIADTLNVPPASFLEGLGQAARGRSAPQADGADELMMLFIQLPPGMRAAVLQLAQSLTESLRTGSRSADRRGGRRAPAEGEALTQG